MMSEYEGLVKRLRDYSAARKGEIAELTREAADAIEELQRECLKSKIEEKREALLRCEAELQKSQIMASFMPISKMAEEGE